MMNVVLPSVVMLSVVAPNSEPLLNQTGNWYIIIVYTGYQVNTIASPRACCVTINYYRNKIGLTVIRILFVFKYAVGLGVFISRPLCIVSYPKISLIHPSRNFFALSLFCVLMHVCMAKSERLNV
jgi:hypothetical protein